MRGDCSQRSVLHTGGHGHLPGPSGFWIFSTNFQRLSVLHHRHVATQQCPRASSSARCWRPSLWRAASARPPFQHMQPAPPPPLPPDPSASSAQPRVGGVVLRWNAEKGFGFIRPHDGGQDLFCHAYNIDDGNALGEGFDVSFVRKYDDTRGKMHADQVCGGVGPRPGGSCDPLLTPCLPYGLEVLASEAQPPRPARAGKRTREQAQQEAIDTSWLSLSAVVRSIGQVPLETQRVGAWARLMSGEASARHPCSAAACSRAPRRF